MPYLNDVPHERSWEIEPNGALSPCCAKFLVAADFFASVVRRERTSTADSAEFFTLMILDQEARPLHCTSGKGGPMLIGSVVSLSVLATAALVFFTISKLIGGLGNKGS